MRILVISEGNNELGRTGKDAVSGALIQLVKRVLTPLLPLEKFQIEQRDNRSFGVVTKKDWGTGGADYQRKAMSWIRKAQNEQFDAIVIVVDQDDASDRRKGLDAAQADNRLLLPRAIGLAVKSFDAWMLADERAISNAIGRTVQRQKAPEDHNSPKNTMLGIVADSRAMTDAYAKIADLANIETLCTRCPKGFKPFRDRLAKLAAHGS